MLLLLKSGSGNLFLGIENIVFASNDASWTMKSSAAC